MKNLKIDRTGRLSKQGMSVLSVLIAVGGLLIITGGAVEAGEHDGSLCGNNELCRSLEGREFQLIRYSSGGTRMVVLYERSKAGEVTISNRENTYVVSRGTVNDAIKYVSRAPNYSWFRLREGKKSTGFLKYERVEGLYLVKPRYKSSSYVKTPRHYIKEENGTVMVHVKPVQVQDLGDDYRNP